MAIMLVFIIRLFFLEPFHIPTTSMEPTIIGDPKYGDQILVDKVYYQTNPLKRWDIIVFEYPLQQNKNFIKRLIGLPGEKITLQDGNIFVNDKIARKPFALQESLKYIIYPREKNFSESWKVNNAWQVQDDYVRLNSSQENLIRFRSQIDNRQFVDGTIPRSQPLSSRRASRLIGELAWQANVIFHSSQDVLVVQIRKNDFLYTLYLGNRGEIVVSRDDFVKRYSFSGVSLPGKYQVRFQNFDHQLMVFIDEQVVFQQDENIDISFLPVETYESGLSFGGKGKIDFSALKVWRDIYYLERKNLLGKSYEWKVPPRQLFVLGDNSPHSTDSRDWRKYRFYLRNGLVKEGDQDNYPRSQDGFYYLEDLTGQKLKIPRSERKYIISNVPAPFVPESALVGKALMIFLPFSRSKIIH